MMAVEPMPWFFQMLERNHRLGRVSIWKNRRTDASVLPNAREKASTYEHLEELLKGDWALQRTFTVQSSL